MIRKISAHYVFPVSDVPVKYGRIEVNSSGEILKVESPGEMFREIAQLEFFDGILIPAFVKENFETDQMVFTQMLQLQNQFPDIPLEKLIWRFTLDRAVTKNLGTVAGSLEISKRPGVMLISGIDFRQMKLTGQSRLKVIIRPGFEV